MSDGWYYLAFGIELGPMSWDDLAERAARGDLRPESQVREGAKGAWVAAREIPQLFASGGGAPTADAWHCEFMGAELGPMSWDDLRRLVERGDVRGDSRIRKHADQEWRPAATIASLFPSAGAAAAEADFEFAHNPASDSEADFEFAGSERIAATADDNRHDGQEEQNAVAGGPPSIAKPSAPLATDPPSAAASSPSPAPEASVIDRPASAPAFGGLRKQKQKPERKKHETGPKPKTPRAPIELALPPRFVKGLAAALLLGGAGWLAYFGYSHLGSQEQDDLRSAAAGLEQIYGEVQAFRKNPKGGPPMGIGIQVMPRIASLRHRVSQAPAESAGGALDQAGARLAEMLADDRLGGSDSPKYAEAERQFLTLLGDAKQRLGQ
ncbi:MAG TPA: DUF4339 domain-containing protein [Pirellulales bacterium]|nr:DUF4339 domain-containing protein [Pirellulales bacterium]